MKDVVVVYNNDDGAMHILNINNHMFDVNSLDRLLLKDAGVEFKSNQEVLDHLIKKHVPEKTSYHVMSKSELPEDWSNRDKWQFDHEKGCILC